MRRDVSAHFVPDPSRPVRRLPRLPIVTAVAGALIASGCDSPRADDGRDNDIARVCQDENGRRVPDDECNRGRGGHAFMFVPLMRAPAMGGAVVGGVSNPANVSRGGFGMSAHGSSAA